MLSPACARFEDGVGGSRLSRGDRERRCAAFERGDALLERVPGRILNAGVDIAELFESEEPRGVGRVLKLVGGRLVDRHRHRAADRVGPVGAAVQRQRVTVELSIARSFDNIYNVDRHYS